jgi:hypothetical protein
MRALHFAVLLAPLALGCRIDLDHNEQGDDMTGRSCKMSTATVCKEAETHSDFEWIESKIFVANCFGSSCHSDATSSGNRDLSKGHAYATLMGPSGDGNVIANLDPNHRLVVPGEPENSYLFFLLKGVKATDSSPPHAEPPSDVGYMPMSNATLCCQKIDAIERWITAGAMND